MNETRAARYQRLRRRVRAAEVASAAAALTLIAWSPVAAWLSGAASSAVQGLAAGGQTIAIGVFVTAVVVIVDVATMPASVFAAARVQARYRGEPWSVARVCLAHAQALAIVLPAAWASAAVVMVSRAMAGRAWWAVAGGVIAIVWVAAIVAGPALLARLAVVRPIARPGLAHRLRRLASDAGVGVADVVEWQVGAGAAATALLAGVGRYRRVLLAADLAADWSDDEVAVVVAHELGHVVRGDLWRAWGLDVLVVGTALVGADVAVRWRGGAAGTADVLPVIALVALAVWTAATPLRHAQSRAHERHADQFALALTNQPEVFAAAMRRLAARHLVEERPSLLARWFYARHPSVAERIEVARGFQRLPGEPEAEAIRAVRR